MFPLILVIVIIIAITLVIGSLQVGSYIEINSKNEWKISRDYYTINGKKWSLEYANGNFSGSLLLLAGPATSQMISVSVNGLSYTVEIAPNYDPTYTLNFANDGVVFSIKSIRNGMIFTLQQAGNEFGYAVGIEIK